MGQDAQPFRRRLRDVSVWFVDEAVGPRCRRRPRATSELWRERDGAFEALDRGAAQSRRDRFLDDRNDAIAETQAHVALRRVDVGIELVRRHADVQHAVRVTADHREGAIGSAPCTAQDRAAQQTSVHEHDLTAPVRPVVARSADPALHARAGFGRTDRDHRRRAASEHVAQSRSEVVAWRERERRLSIVLELERDLRVREREGRKPGRDAVELGGRRTQVFAPHRNLGEERACDDARPRRTGERVRFANLFSVRIDRRRHFRAGGTRAQRDGGDGRDRGQAFAAKAQRVDAAQTGGVFQLRGRVTSYRKAQLVRRDPHPVVRDLDLDQTSAAHPYRNSRRVGVERVFDEFLDDRDGALDDFAGRDLSDRLRIEDAYHSGAGRSPGVGASSRNCGSACGSSSRR